MTPEALRAALQRLGLTQVAFARQIGRSPITVNRWLSGALPVPRWVDELALFKE